MWWLKREVLELQEEVADLKRDLHRFKRDDGNIYLYKKDMETYWGMSVPTMHAVPIRAVVELLAEKAGLQWDEGSEGHLITKPKGKKK